MDAEAEVLGLVVAPGEDAVRAWARLPAGTRVAYVRFPRRGDVPLAAVQRLARRGSVIVDAAPRDPDDVLDLAVAGAAGVVAWLAEGGDVAAMADAMGDGFLLGCTPADLDRAAALAREHGFPLLVSGAAEPADGLRGFHVDLGTEPVILRRFGAWPELAHHEPEAAPEADADEPDDADDAGEGDEEEGGVRG